MSRLHIVVAGLLCACGVPPGPSGEDPGRSALRAVTLEPAAPTVADVLVARADVDEVAGSDLALTWVWTVDGREVARGPAATLEGGFAKAQVVRATAVPRVDGETGEGLGAEVRVVNTPPLAGTVALVPELPRAWLTDLVCAPPPEAADADGDALAWTFAWTRDGEAVTEGLRTGAWPDDTVPADLLREGERWACTAEVDDGEVAVAAQGAERVVGFGVPPRVGVPEAGAGFTCVLSEDGVPTCWGADEPSRAPLDERFARLAVGTRNACGLRRSDLSLACWGSSTWGLTEPPEGSFVEVAVGEEHACALRPGGEAVCWGRPGWPATLPPTDEGPWERLFAGTGHTCGLQGGGHPKCWGGGWGGPSAEPFAEVFDDLALGTDHGCGLRGDGSVRCWGSVAQGQGSPPSGTWVALGARPSGTCGIEAGGELVCWGVGAGRYPWGASTLSLHGGFHACGRADDGGLRCAYLHGGTGRAASFGEDRAPTERWAALSVGERMVCGLDAQGLPDCFGPWGRLDLPTEPLVALGAGTEVACGVRQADGRAVCWGQAANAGVDAVPDDALQAVAVGDGVACGLRPDGEAVCWGDLAVTPEAGPFTTIAVADDYACGLGTTGIVSCWGPTDPRTAPPQRVFVTLDADVDHACGVTLAGGVACWGRGALPADRGGSYASVSVALGNACAVTTGGRLDCWGTPRFGLTEPPAVLGLERTDGGGELHCGLDGEDRLFCWGIARRLPLGWTPPP